VRPLDAAPPAHDFLWGDIRMKRWLAIFLIATFATLSFAQEHSKNHQPTLTPQNSGTTNRLQAVSPVNSDVVWASGLGGTFAVTTDGGETWKAGVVPGAETLQFRDVQGVSRKVAYLLSSGTGTDSRIYKTVDGGVTWTMQFQASNPNDFYDCFAFWTPKRGIVQGDAVNGEFPDLRTTDGVTWEDISNNLPPALPSEGSFAASGTCVATQGARNAWIATSGGTLARILVTRDGGETWNAYDTPLVGGTGTAGAFTVAFRDSWNGVVGGGDFVGIGPAAMAKSRDGGQTWMLTNTVPVTGAIFGLSYVSRVEGDEDGEDGHAVLVTGPAGAAWTPDEGNTWFTLPGVTGYWAVAFASPEAGWLVGTGGRILKISF
jgi:photosystem II stability/assembly factor-like uncharacterized protein